MSVQLCGEDCRGLQMLQTRPGSGRPDDPPERSRIVRFHLATIECADTSDAGTSPVETQGSDHRLSSACSVPFDGKRESSLHRVARTPAVAELSSLAPGQQSALPHLGPLGYNAPFPSTVLPGSAGRRGRRGSRRAGTAGRHGSASNKGCRRDFGGSPTSRCRREILIGSTS